MQNQNDHLGKESKSSASANAEVDNDSQTITASLQPPSSPFANSETLQQKEVETQDMEIITSEQQVLESTPDVTTPFVIQAQMNPESTEEESLEPPSLDLQFAGAESTPPDGSDGDSNAEDINNNSANLPTTQTKEKAGPFSPINNLSKSTHDDTGSNDIVQQMEYSFGQDFSNVNIHQDSTKASEIGARAFAQGNDIHFASGAYQPNTQIGKELIGHEFTHVVQQRQGRVQPTIQGKGFQINDDSSLENEADEMGAKAARGEMVPFNISSYKAGDNPAVQRKVIQRTTEIERARQEAERLNVWLSAPNLIHFSTIRNFFISNHINKRLIKQQYHEITNRSVEYDLKAIYSPGGNPSLDLAEFWPFLFRNSNAGLYNDIATFLLPTGAAEEHLYTTLRRLGDSQDSRQRLVDDYNSIYGHSNSETSIILGNGTLLSDIRNDEGLSDLDQQKIAGLLHHKPTDAEKIFWHSVAISGTHNSEIFSILKTTFAGGPNKINQLYTEWYNYIRSTRGWSSGLGSSYKLGTWTSQELNNALRDEFQVNFTLDLHMIDRDRRILNAFIMGFTSIRAMQNQQDPQVHEMEEEQIRVSETILNEAVNEVGTNETVVYMQLRNIRSIYERRLSRASENGDPAFLAEHQGYWERKRTQLWNLVQGEMEEGFSESRQARMILFGNINELPTQDSEMGIHHIENTVEETINTEILSAGVDWDSVEQQVTNTFKSRELNVETFNRNIENEGPENFQQRLLRDGSELNFRRIMILTQNRQSEFNRGALRLKFEFDQGRSESAISGVIRFLTGMNQTLKQNILRVLAGSPDIVNTGNQQEDFITFITNHYPETASRYELLDLVVPADSVLEQLTRAESRVAIEGLGEHIEGRSIRYGRGTETLIAHHHLERLRELQRLTHATDGELESVLESYDKTDLSSIAEEDYDIIVVQLREIHAQREQMKEYLITALEMGVETALTVLTAGAFGGALIACLGSKMAGVLARDIAFDNYEALSVANLQDVALSIASLGTGRFTNDIIGNTFSGEILESMTRSNRLMVELWRETQTAVLNQSIEAAVNQRIPSGEEIFQSAVAILASAGGAATSLRYNSQGHIMEAQTLAEHVRNSMVNSMVSGGIESSGNLIANSGSQTSSQLVGNAALGMGRPMLSGLNSGLSSYGEQRVEAHRERSASRETDHNSNPSQVEVSSDDENPVESHRDIVDHEEVDHIFDLSQVEVDRRGAHLENNLQGNLNSGIESTERSQQMRELEALVHIVREHGAADQYYEARQILENEESSSADLERAQSLIDAIQVMGSHVHGVPQTSEGQQDDTRNHNEGTFLIPPHEIDAISPLDSSDQGSHQISLYQHLNPDMETTETLVRRPEGDIAAKMLGAFSDSSNNIQDIHFILDTAIADTRFIMAGDNNGRMLNFVNMGGQCGLYRDYSGFILESLPENSGMVVRRMTTDTAFGQEQADYSHITADGDFNVDDFVDLQETENSQHVFNIVSFPNGTHFILDSTFSQFISANQSLEGTRASHLTQDQREQEFSGDQHLDSGATRPLIDQLLNRGYIPLTEENALLYSHIIGYSGNTSSSEMLTNMVSGAQDNQNPINIEAFRTNLQRGLSQAEEGSEQSARISSILAGMGATNNGD